MRCLWLAFCLLGFHVSAMLVHAHESQARALWALAERPLLIEQLYKQPKRVGSNFGLSGACSVNRDFVAGRSREYFIEQQRYGANWVQAGLLTGDEEVLRTGLRVLEWGWAMQHDDGSFPRSGDAIHSASLYLEAVGRAYLLIAISERADLQQRVADWPLRIERLAHWMERADRSQAKRRSQLEPFTHRYYLRALGLLQASLISGREDLSIAAKVYLRDGLARQREDGTDPERGGFDANYQAYGNLLKLRLLVQLEEVELKAALRENLLRALEPLLARVQPNGSVDVEGDSRAKEKARSGRPKRFNTVALLELLGGLASLGIEVERFDEVAVRVAAHYYR